MIDISLQLKILSLIGVVGFLIHFYSSKEVGLLIKFICFISWLISFGIIIIIPADVYYVKLIIIKNK